MARALRAVDQPVIIVGDSPDPHVQSVRAGVERLGVPCLVLDESVTRVRICYCGSEMAVEAKLGKIWIRLDSARSIWWWRKETTTALAHADDFAADFITREFRSLLESLEWLLRGARWPIRPTAVRRASLKCHQLALAQELGFRIPTTVVTNDAQSVLSYVGADPSRFPAGIVYKPLTWYVGLPDRFLYTEVVTLEELASSSASISVAPCQFQEYVKKSYEVRATVVGHDVFAVRIDSQSRDDTRLDWRRNQHDVPYKCCELPSDTIDRLHRFLRECGLVYGAFDLVVSEDGDLTFLELNPMGQWLWLENRLNIDISAAVSRLLVEG
jgi:hypothetical protein